MQQYFQSKLTLAEKAKYITRHIFTERRYWPGTNSMTIMIGWRRAAIPINLTTLGWLYCWSAWPSWRNVNCMSSPRSSRHVLTATVRPNDFRRPRNTSPNWPCSGQTVQIQCRLPTRPAFVSHYDALQTTRCATVYLTLLQITNFPRKNEKFSLSQSTATF